MLSFSCLLDLFENSCLESSSVSYISRISELSSLEKHQRATSTAIASKRTCTVSKYEVEKSPKSRQFRSQQVAWSCHSHQAVRLQAVGWYYERTAFGPRARPRLVMARFGPGEAPSGLHSMRRYIVSYLQPK